MVEVINKNKGYCRYCGELKNALSHRGICPECATKKVNEMMKERKSKPYKQKEKL